MLHKANRKSNNEIIYGFYCICGHECILEGKCDCVSHFIGYPYNCDESLDRFSCINGGFIEIDPNTLARSTEIVDDNAVHVYGSYEFNGHMTTGGDIISYEALGSLFKGQVQWCKSNLTWVVDAVDGDGLRQRKFLAHIHTFEIISIKDGKQK